METNSKLVKRNGFIRQNKLKKSSLVSTAPATSCGSNDFAEAVVRTARDPLLVLDANLRVEIVNDAFYTTFKVRRDESIGRSLFDLDHHHWDIPKLRELLEDILPRHSFFNDFEVTHDFEHIGRRTMLLNARTLKDAVGRPERVLLGIQDITESLHFQGETKRSELRYRRLFETSSDGILLIDPATRQIIDANTAICRLLGDTAPAIIGKQLPQIGILRNERALKNFFDELETSSFSQRDCLNIDTFRGEERQVECISSLYHEGAHSVIQCNIRDITSRLRIREELKNKDDLLEQSELYYRTLFNSIDEGFCIIEVIPAENGKPQDYRFIECNNSFEKQAGFAPCGRRMREIEPSHEEHWFETYGRVASTGRSVRFVYQAVALKRWFDVFAFPAGPSESRKVAILFRDITSSMDEKASFQQSHLDLQDHAINLEKAVAKRTADLTAAYQQLEDFVYSVSHDLRAPLRSMAGFSTLLLEEAKASLTEEAQGFAARIRASAGFMDALLRDLIAFGGITGKSIRLESVNLENIIRLAVTSLQDQIDQKRAQIEIIDLGHNVLADEPTLGLVLTNLLENALKFVPQGIQPNIKIRAEDIGQSVQVWIEDNGIGIAPEYHEQIFRMFTRLNGDSYQGTGIGLAIVKKGIERMSGHSGVLSSLGQGSRFWLELSKPLPSPRSLLTFP